MAPTPADVARFDRTPFTALRPEDDAEPLHAQCTGVCSILITTYISRTELCC